MNVYYKRVTTWQKWPDNDLVDTDVVEYSLSKKKWNKIHETTPMLTMPERQVSVGIALRITPTKINLIKP